MIGLVPIDNATTESIVLKFMTDLSAPSNTDLLDDTDLFLQAVRERIVATLAETTLRDIMGEAKSLTGLGGKMLRSRLACILGRETGADPDLLIYGSAAVEMIHTASLLHDDVIDGGLIRRGMPTFWVEKGKAGAILLGDLFLFKAIDLICRVADGRYTHDLVKLTGEVCEAESEQELVLHASDAKLDICHSIARRKTGALFAFTAMIAGDGDKKRVLALKEAGYLLGTAYQLADDLLDVTGSDDSAGKTLGTDAARDIVSAASLTDVDLVSYLDELCERALAELSSDEAATRGAQVYIDTELNPAMDKLTGRQR